MEVVVEEMPLEPVSEQEWPSIASFTDELQSDSEVVDVGSSSEGQWPSITSPSSAGVDNAVLKRSGHPLLLRSKLKNPSKKLWILKTTPLNCLQLFLMMFWPRDLAMCSVFRRSCAECR